MSEANIDALLMFKQESMYWLTGYDTFGYVFFQCLVLDKSGNIILLTRAPDLRQAQNTSIIKDIRIWIDKAGANPNDDLKRILNELKLEGKKIGIEYDAYGLTGRNAMLLNKSLNGFYKIEDKSELISKLRVIKSVKEISYVKKAAELADKALDEVWKLIQTYLQFYNNHLMICLIVWHFYLLIRKHHIQSQFFYPQVLIHLKFF